MNGVSNYNVFLFQSNIKLFFYNRQKIQPQFVVLEFFFTKYLKLYLVLKIVKKKKKNSKNNYFLFIKTYIRKK